MPQFSEDKRYNDPMKNAKGLGSAHHGVEHWMMQRVTAIANLPLLIWLIYSMISLQGASYYQFTDWLASPLNAILMILLMISAFYHARLGVREVSEDYISNKSLKVIKRIGQTIFFFAFAVASIFSILKIAFTAGM